MNPATTSDLQHSIERAAPSQETRFPGLDYLRAVAALLVVMWHTQVFGPFAVFTPDRVSSIIPTVTDILYYDVCLLAVPVFFQISLFLYILNRKNKKGYFRRRIVRLFLLYFFWGSFSLLFVYPVLFHTDPRTFFSDFTNAAETIMTGGRSLYYYFFSLLCCVAVLEYWLYILQKINSEKASAFLKTGVLVISLFSMLLFPHILAHLGFQTHYWIPLNFFPYIFTAVLLADRLDNLGKIILWAGLLYMVFSLFDWLCLPYYIWSNHCWHALPPYTRISVVFGALFVVSCGLKIRGSAPFIVRKLSEYSLGIYCLHTLIEPGIFPGSWWIAHNGGAVGLAAYRVMVSVLLTYFFKKIPVLKSAF
ncbi:MAG: acyltransferase [Desulfomonile tiedjei]|uniref:Acyltransferase n=1 Tax=Desulfomonile tiedjei TaxID=2358 RepID=A0A9D6V4G3_9BACT|nr:acyltransferase [Desulfomonile tiedjei]